jgi:replicative DNA helicase
MEGPNGSLTPRSAIEVLVDLNDKVTAGNVAEYQPVPLGFTPLDKTIGAGLRTGELLLIGGAQGTGKTTMALQMARNVASGGQANVLYICFEHDELYLLNRLIAAESALPTLPQTKSAIKIQDVRREILGSWTTDRRSSRRTHACGRRWTGSPATGRTCSSSGARRRRARSTASASSSACIASCPATAGCW